MVLPSIYWKPEVLFSDAASHLTTPPQGVPDPRFVKDLSARTPRPRIALGPQMGPTCIYFAACRITQMYSVADVFGEFEKNQLLVSLFFNTVASLHEVCKASMDPEIKEAIFYTTIANAGLFFFFTPQFFQKLRADFLSFPDRMRYFMSLGPEGVKQKFRDYIADARRFSVHLLHHVSIQRLGLHVHSWEPINGMSALVPVFKAHLYVMSIGRFGVPFFKSIYKVEESDQLGPVFSGPLKPYYHPGQMTLNHAIILIGIKMFSRYKGFVYFIDPNDGSGPHLKQTVYRIKAIDFLRRITDIDGYFIANPFLKRGRFVWVGQPHVFLC